MGETLYTNNISAKAAACNGDGLISEKVFRSHAQPTHYIAREGERSEGSKQFFTNSNCSFKTTGSQCCKRLVGIRVLKVANALEEGRYVRAYTHCAKSP